MRARPPGLAEQRVPARPLALLEPHLSPGGADRLHGARARLADALAGRTVWTVNSTARGGGVAEMQRTLGAYWRGAGVDVRWLVLQAPMAYFELTKRLHNRLHGDPRAAPLGAAEERRIERATAAAAAELAAAVAPGDVVILHDPQTAPLVTPARRAGAVVVWRCHVGVEHRDAISAGAWAFLLPWVAEADATVFTRAAYVPDGLDSDRAWICAPAIDPCSPKNQPLDPATADAILEVSGLAAGAHGRARARRAVPLAWGGELAVHRAARVLRAAPGPPRLGEERLVVALARWDRLKDPAGIVRGFAEHVRTEGVRLIVAGARPFMVDDDPEGAGVLRDVTRTWRELPARQRRRIDLAVLPMTSLDENALIVNALQRRAEVVVKKSLQEGFGLGVAEALWKARPVVATAVGGHVEQLADRHTGLLVHDPEDLAAFGAAVTESLERTGEARVRAARGRVWARSHLLADRHMADWATILGAVLGGASAGPAPARRSAPLSAQRA